jgi:hypothetical protein
MARETAEEGFILDVTYTDAGGNDHLLLLEVNCVKSTWTSYDARLNAILTGTHRPPGINATGGITGTAFTVDGGSGPAFVLGNFLAIPFYPSKYPTGTSGTGRWLNVPSPYRIDPKNMGLSWEVAERLKVTRVYKAWNEY